MPTLSRPSAFPLLLALVSLLIQACATAPATPSAKIEVVKHGMKPGEGGDCPVSINVFNRTDSAWFGSTYYLVLRDASGAALTQLSGDALRYTEPGYGASVPRSVKGIQCEKITSVSLISFNYWGPNGSWQLKPNTVTLELR